MLDSEIDDTITELLLVARGDYILVEESLLKALKQEKLPWWKFWSTPKHFIDFKEAAEYIIEGRNKIDNMEVANAESPTL